MKWGLGESYSNTSVLSEKTRAYLDLTKPASTLGIAIGVVVASFFYMEYTGDYEPVTLVARVAIVTALSHGASQAMNMAEDAEMDRNTPHKQNRPIPSGVVSEEEARTIAWFMMVMAIGGAFLINSILGVFISILATMGVFYNLKPIRAKTRIISIPWQATSRGLFFFPVIWAAYGNPWTVTPWVLGVFMFFYVFGFQNSADIIDREVDEQYGIKTFIVVFGVKKVMMIAAGSMLLMVATILLAINYNILPPRMSSILLIIPFCLAMLYHMTFNTHEVSDRTGNHPAWLWFYLGMVITVSIPYVVEVFQ